MNQEVLRTWLRMWLWTFPWDWTSDVGPWLINNASKNNWRRSDPSKTLVAIERDCFWSCAAVRQSLGAPSTECPKLSVCSKLHVKKKKKKSHGEENGKKRETSQRHDVLVYSPRFSHVNREQMDTADCPRRCHLLVDLSSLALSVEKSNTSEVCSGSKLKCG